MHRRLSVIFTHKSRLRSTPCWSYKRPLSGRGMAAENTTGLEYLCLITTPSYAPGAVCLAQSLALCGSKAVLKAIATSVEAERALLEEIQRSPNPPPPIVVELRTVELPKSASDETHGAKGANLSVDAPRRILFSSPQGFVLLDADLVAVQNPDVFLSLSPGEPMKASANFRIKKQAYGTAKDGGNFNAGVMVVSTPEERDGDLLHELVVAASELDTEELLLNKVFRNRWSELPPGLNVPKRVMHHAPALWNRMIKSKEIVFVHYMGAKPWMTDVAKRTKADWESERPEYLELEKLWWSIRSGKIINEAATDLLDHIPLAKEIT